MKTLFKILGASASGVLTIVLIYVSWIPKEVEHTYIVKNEPIILGTVTVTEEKETVKEVVKEVEKKPVQVKPVKTEPVVEKVEPVVTVVEPVVEEKPIENPEEITDWHIKKYLYTNTDTTNIYRIEGQPVQRNGIGANIRTCVAHVTHYTGYKFDEVAKTFERGFEIEINKNYDFEIECFAKDQSVIVK